MVWLEGHIFVVGCVTTKRSFSVIYVPIIKNRITETNVVIISYQKDVCTKLSIHINKFEQRVFLLQLVGDSKRVARQNYGFSFAALKAHVGSFCKNL